LLVVGLAGCGGGGGGSAQKQACDQTMAATCDRAFTCGGATWSDMGFSSVAECTKAMQTAICASVACGAGETYHADQAQKCLDETKAQSCADVSSGVVPGACDQVCSSGGGTGGGGGGGGSGGGGGGTGGSSAPACTGTFNACGGDPTGTWDVMASCIEGNLVSALNAQLGADYSACGNAYTAASVALTGSVTYGAGNYNFDAAMEVVEAFAYTPACVSAISGGTALSASVCSQLEQSLNGTAGTTATCTYATNCSCHAIVSQTNTTSGTFTVSGSTITEDSGTSYQFCVSGNTMTQRELIEGNVYGVVQMRKR
jgi:hypothetical protein